LSFLRLSIYSSLVFIALFLRSHGQD